MAFGVAQIGWEFAREKPIDAMQWMSLFLVVGSGAATLFTDDPRFVMVKPSLGSVRPKARSASGRGRLGA